MSEKVEVCYVVSGSSRGLGGHQFSVRDLALASGGHYQSSVVQIGAMPNPCFEVLGKRFLFMPLIFHNPKTIFSALRHIKNISESKTICFIVFDFLSLSLVRLSLRGADQPYVLCKPGGANWPVRTKNVPALLVFSEENLDYFKVHDPELSRRAFLIHGRVKAVNRPTDIEQALINSIPFAGKVFCVARFAHEKLPIFIHSINLFEQYFSEKPDFVLCVIGLPSDGNVVEIVSARILNSPLRSRIRLLTSPDFYEKASRFFGCADYLIGNGRTVIEALSLGIPAFVAVDARPIPILVNAENIDNLSRQNLSLRNDVDESKYLANLDNINKVVNCKREYESSSQESRSIFIRFYDICVSQETILRCIKQAEKNKKVVKMELNDLRMLFVGLITVNYAKLSSVIIAPLKKIKETIR